MCEGVRISNVSVVKETDKSILVAYDDMNMWRWVPKSVIRHESEVWKPGQGGTLVVEEWWARKSGLQDDCEAYKSTQVTSRIPFKKDASRAVSDTLAMVLQLIESLLAKPSSTTDAVCECGQCNGDDPMRHHETARLRELRASVEKCITPAASGGARGSSGSR